MTVNRELDRVYGGDYGRSPISIADRCPTCHGPKHPRIVLQAQHVDAPRDERWTPRKVLGVSLFAVIFVYMLAVVMTGMAVPA